MPTASSRIQVTIDEELAKALEAVDPAPASRSRLVRDLALRGASAVCADRQRSEDAARVLLEIADGERDYDLAASAVVAAVGGDRLPRRHALATPGTADQPGNDRAVQPPSTSSVAPLQ